MNTLPINDNLLDSSLNFEYNSPSNIFIISLFQDFANKLNDSP